MSKQQAELTDLMPSTPTEYVRLLCQAADRALANGYRMEGIALIETLYLLGDMDAGVIALYSQRLAAIREGAQAQLSCVAGRLDESSKR